MYLIPVIISIIIIVKVFYLSKNNFLKRTRKIYLTILLISISSFIQFEILFSKYYNKLAVENSLFLLLILLITLFVIPYLMSKTFLLLQKKW